MSKLGKVVFVLFILITGFFLFIAPAEAQQEPLIVDFFDDRLCPVCRATKEFMLGLQDDYPQMELRIHPISDIAKLKEVAKVRGFDDYKIMSPTIFIGNNLFQFRDFTPRQEEMILRALGGETIENNSLLIRIPILNREVNIENWSLPLITFVLGSIDGFNICSIGALILILSIVSIFDSRKKMFLFGGAFILTSVAVYGILIFVWGHLFEILIGHLGILRIIIGLTALGGGIYFFKEFWRFFKHGPTCQISNSKLAAKATKKMKEALETPNKGIIPILGSVIFFAAVITIIELPCSIGLPLTFTGILVEQNLSLSTYTLYILGYLFFFMLDELVVFTGAVLTKRIWFSESKIMTWVAFAGGIALFYLAFYYLFS